MMGMGMRQMPNKFRGKERFASKDEYDFVDSKGLGWRLKKGETLDELKIRSKKGKPEKGGKK
jgi:hypothetical protein